MDHNRLGSGGPLDRPITMGALTKEAWITGLVDYVNSMKQICPDIIHPPLAVAGLFNAFMGSGTVGHCFVCAPRQ